MYDSNDTPTNISITIGTTGNTTDFGDLSLARNRTAAASNTTRGLFIGGFKYWAADDTMDYITIDTTGNASDFGDLTVTRESLDSSTNGTRSIFAGGWNGSAGASGRDDTIDYVAIATTGNATDFGNLLAGNMEKPAACSG